jgi:hypothetical protein
MVEERSQNPIAPPGGAPRGRGARAVQLAVMGLIALGCALRTAQYLGRSSLWHDELAVAINVQERGLAQLLGEPLAHRQVAPLGFLTAVELSTRLFGVDELGLRLVAWLFGLASVVLFWRVARRFASGAALLAGLALFAASPALTVYAASVKPYAGDVAATLLLILLALRYREHPRDLRASALAGVAGGAALFFSFPAVLVAALAALVLALALWRTAPRPPLAPLAALGAGWALGAGITAEAAWGTRDPETMAFMHAFWGERGGFPPPLSAGLGAPAWAPRQVLSVFAHFLLYVTPPVLVAAIAAPAAALALVGLPGLWRRDPWSAALLAAPVAAGLLGAYAGLLPFRHRTGLYAGWAVLALGTAGLELVRACLPRRLRFLGTALAALVGAPLALIVLAAARPPYPTQESRPVLEELARRRRPDDVLYAYCGARHAVSFYGPRVGLAGWVQGGAHDDPRDLLRELDAFRGRARLWLFFTQSQGEETLVMRAYLRAIGSELEAIPDPSGSRGEAETAAYLFDLSDPALLQAATAESFPVGR